MIESPKLEKKRDRLRQLGVTQTEYITLTSHRDDNDSTLIREDEHDHNEEHEYDDWQISSTKRQFGDPSKFQAKQSISLYDMDVEDNDDESIQWENDQLAKVGIKQPKSVIIPEILRSGVMQQTHGQFERPSLYEPPDIQTIIKKMKTDLKLMKLVQAEHEHNHHRIKADIKEVEDNQKKFRVKNIISW